MRKRVTAAVGAAVAATVLTGAAGAGEKLPRPEARPAAMPCQVQWDAPNRWRHACRSYVTVRPYGDVRWQSRQRWKDGVLYLRIVARGRDGRWRDLTTERVNRCGDWHYGDGLVVRDNVCGKGSTPIVARIRSVNPRPVRLMMVYLAHREGELR